MTAYLRTLSGANASASTITAYRTDLTQFAAFLAETNCAIAAAADVARTDIAEYLSYLGERGLSGTDLPPENWSTDTESPHGC
jgi:site-specific recombinase XerD